MQSILKLLGLALLEILAGLPFFLFSSVLLSLLDISFEENFLVYLAVTAIPIMLLASLWRISGAFGVPIGLCALRRLRPAF